METDTPARLRALLARAKPRHYPGECDHCGIDELPPETCPALAFIAEIDAALAAAPRAPVESKSVQRRKALMRGEPFPRAVDPAPAPVDLDALARETANAAVSEALILGWDLCRSCGGSGRHKK